MSELKHSEEAFFQKCLELPPEEREQFLDSACSNNAALRYAVLNLLRAHDMGAGILDSLPGEDYLEVATQIQEIAPEEEGPGDQIGRYRLLELIGEGSWGSVWMAEQTEDIERRVALKILKLGLDGEEFLKSFEAERQVLAMMDHPNIARELDAGTTSYGRPYLIMELVKSMPLFDYVNRERLSIEKRVRLFIQICNGIQHAHQKGVIHRDLKPSNILVAVYDNEPVPKIIDFGVAKTAFSLKSAKTLFFGAHTFVGTPIYCSPEQLDFSRLDVDYRSDIYSLGAIFYELLCGLPPFDPDQFEKMNIEVVRRILTKSIPPEPSVRFGQSLAFQKEEIAENRSCQPSRVKHLLRGEIDWIAMKCLEKNLSRRYDTVSDLSQDLEALLDDEMISAAPSSYVYRIGKFIRKKRPSHAIWAEAFAVVLLGFFLLYYVQFRRSSVSAALIADTSIEFTDKSIGVLPLENMSPDPENAFFADGIHDDILANLSKVDDFLVISRVSMVQYRDTEKSTKQIGNELGVRYIVDGSVRRDDNQVRLNVHLIDTQTGGELWAGSYDRPLDDIFAIQSEVAQDIVTNLKVTLSPEEIAQIEHRPTGNPEAYDYYLKAQRGIHASSDGGDEKIALLERAVSLDPNFTEAWAQLAVECIYWWDVNRLRQDADLLNKARFAIDEAVRRNAKLPRVMFAQGIMLYREKRDFDSFLDRMLAVQAESPNFEPALFHLSNNYHRLGRLVEAQHYGELSIHYDPLYLRCNENLLHAYLSQKMWDEARSLIRINIERTPDNLNWRRFLIELEYLKNGELDMYARLIEAIPGFTVSMEGQLWKALQSRDYESALELCEQVDPNASLLGFQSPRRNILDIQQWDLLSGLIWFELGNSEACLSKANDTLTRYESVVQRDPLVSPDYLSQIVICYALKGESDRVEEMIVRIRERTRHKHYQFSYQARCEAQIAIAYIVLGEHEKSIQILEAALLMDSPIFLEHQLPLLFMFDRLRGDPRFESLLKSDVGLRGKRFPFFLEGCERFFV